MNQEISGARAESYQLFAGPGRPGLPAYAFFSVTENRPKKIVSNSGSVVTASM